VNGSLLHLDLTCLKMGKFVFSLIEQIRKSTTLQAVHLSDNDFSDDTRFVIDKMLRIPTQDITKLTFKEYSESNFAGMNAEEKKAEQEKMDKIYREMFPKNPYKSEGGKIYTQPLLYTRQIDYNECIGVGRHSNPYWIVDSHNS
jgi:hypothetical protein